jgi:hypothetical protein
MAGLKYQTFGTSRRKAWEATADVASPVSVAGNRDVDGGGGGVWQLIGHHPASAGQWVGGEESFGPGGLGGGADQSPGLGIMMGFTVSLKAARLPRADFTCKLASHGQSSFSLVNLLL